MAGKLVNITGDPRGRRYTEADREAAYLIWKTNRSLRKTAELIGISHNTVGSWSQEDGWVKRAAREDADDAASMRRAIGAIVVGEMPRNIEVAKQIRDDETASKRDRLEALKWLSGVAGVAAVAKVEQSIVNEARPTDAEPTRTYTVEELMRLSPDELMRLEEETRQRRSA